MIKSKTTVILITLLTIFNITKAQESPMSFNIRGGMNFTTFGGDLDDTKTVLKQQVGVGMEYAIYRNVFLLTGIDYQTKGTKIKPESGNNIKFNAAYLQVPLHVAYKFALSDKVKLSAEAGPYVAYGIGGKIKGERKVNAFGDGRLKKFDCGVGVAIGAEFYRNFLKIGYDYGMCDISDIKRTKIKNRSLFITSGYRF